MPQLNAKRFLCRPAAAFLSAFALLAVLPAAAQDPPPPAPEAPGVFGEVIDVRVVNLEVVVTDRQGNRVTGLGPGDFRLTVDGEAVPIDYFTEVRGGIAVEREIGPAPGAPQGLPALAAGQPVGTSYLVFIDEFFAIQRDRDRVLEMLRQQLPLLAPEDRMAVVAYDGRRLTMLTSWSQSQAELDRTLKEATRRPAHGLQRVAELRQVATNRGLGAFVGFTSQVGTRLTPDERHYASRLIDQIERQVNAAAATLRSFAMPPGRKVMLLLAGGWPFDPAQFIAENSALPVLDLEFERGDELFQPLADTANLLGYTIYPVDLPGMTATAADASVGGSNTAGVIGGRGAGGDNAAAAPVTSLADSQLQEQEVHTSLSYLARRTGGRALLNSARGDALSAAASDTRSYYWLGFTPQRARDDEGHRIRVEVTRPGLRVRSRAGFLDFSRQAEVTALVESTLLFGNAPATGALPVELGEPTKSGRNRMQVPLRLAIPVDAVTVLPASEGHATELELRVAVIDEEGDRADIPVIPLRFAGEAPPAAGGFLHYETSLQLRRQKHEIVVALYDPASGRILSNRVEVRP